MGSPNTGPTKVLPGTQKGTTLSGPVSFGESACKIVERGSQIVGCLTRHDAKPVGRLFDTLKKVVASAGFGFVIDREYAGISLPPIDYRVCEVVDLFLGPLQSSATSHKISTSHVCLQRQEA